MKVIVIHEDGDRTSRVETLVGEIRTCIEDGSMCHMGVVVESKLECAGCGQLCEGDFHRYCPTRLT